MVDQEKLDEIVRRIVEAVEPEKIILFGSAARGDSSSDSDVDVLVIKEGADHWQAATRIYRKLAGVRVAVDAVVVTPQDVERYRDSHALVIAPALREGKVLYAVA